MLFLGGGLLTSQLGLFKRRGHRPARLLRPESAATRGLGGPLLHHPGSRRMWTNGQMHLACI